MFNNGDVVIFKQKTKNKYAWNLIEYNLYKIHSHIDTHNKGRFYDVIDMSDIKSQYSWYHEKDFISLSEYRKQKLQRIENETHK